MKAVVLLSGGLDSAVCLAHCVDKFGAENVYALNMFYGQRHDKELQCAEDLAKHYGVQLIRRDLSSIFEFSDSTMLAGRAEVPTGTYAEQQKGLSAPVSTYVPFRNGLFLSIASAIAYSLKAQYVVLGAHADDAAGNAYPDCTVEFRDTMERAVELGTDSAVTFFTPFIHKHKAAIVKRGIELDVPFDLTWSCYNNEGEACGECGTCLDRLKAFQDNNAKDMIPYKG